MTGIRMPGVDCVGFIIITSSRWISATSVSYGHKRILWPQAYQLCYKRTYCRAAWQSTLCCIDHWNLSGMGKEQVDQRMTMRRMPFSYTKNTNAHWNKDKPEFSQIVNAASLAMPYLEPYLIRTMRQARPEITDLALQQSLDQYVFQEAQHYQQHRKYNHGISSTYESAVEIERRLAKDYKSLEENRSLRFNLAYAEGFESMALAIGGMLIEEREFLFGNSDSTVASLVLWHFVEEIEHKNVAFDVFDHLHHSYFWRMVGLVYATGHIFWRTARDTECC